MTFETDYPLPLSYILSESRLEDNGHSLLEFVSPCGRFLYHSPDIKVGCAKHEVSGNFVICIGLLLEVQKSLINNRAISEYLLAAYEIGEDYFYGTIDRVAGRYVIVYGNATKKSAYILGDCFGSLKITYNENLRAVSSNIFLINRFLERGLRTFAKEFLDYRQEWKFGVLGSLQPLQNYEILTPNHCLDLANYKSRRFYPRKRLAAGQDLATVSEYFIQDVDRQLALLNDEYILFQSLTAGYDSRLSLALNGKASETIFFTYLFKDDHRVDSKVSSEIAGRLKLDHYLLVGGDVKIDEDDQNYRDSKIIFCQSDNAFVEKINRWDWYRHGSGIVSALRNNLIGSQGATTKVPLHIRSNLYETVRAFWGKEEVFHVDEILPNSRRNWIGRGNIFDAYFRAAEFQSAASYGYNLLDIFYWEHRCGTWVSEVNQGTDFAFNTHTFLSTRKTVELMLGIDFRSRKAASIFGRIIDQKLPSLQDFPINPK